MLIVLKKSTSKKPMMALASDALDARLYVSGWGLQPKLKSIIGQYRSAEAIVVAYLDGMAVGVCILNKSMPNDKPYLMTFVRKKHRRHGIGTKLIRRAIGKHRQFRYNIGAKATAKFFDTLPESVYSPYL